jgi:hypothetical protein
VHISQCTNGHLLCYECSTKVIDCSICRVKSRARNTFAESYVKLYMGKTPTRCKHFRCKASMMLGEGTLYRHEQLCIYTEVHCFDKAQCSYFGPIAELYQHVHTNKCAKIIRAYGASSKQNSVEAITYNFTHKLMDGDEASATSPSDRNKTRSYWKPINFFIKCTIAACLSLSAQITAQVDWHLMLFAKLPRNCLKFLKVKVTIGNSKEEHSFITPVLSGETSIEEALEETSHVVMSESIISKFLVSSCEGSINTLTYRIEVTPDAELVGRLSNNEMHLSYEDLFKTAKNESQVSIQNCHDRVDSRFGSYDSSNSELSGEDSSEYEDAPSEASGATAN